MKKLLSSVTVLLVFMFFALPVPIFAQERSDTVTMEEVVVTAGRVEEKKKEITSNITIIDEEEIKMSTANDIGELLAEKGIGYIKRYPGALTAIGIRGFRTETHGNDLMGHVLILLNGRRAGTGNLAKIMTKNVERVEIIRGPAAAQYGSAAMGGVVNIITKQGKGKPSVFVEGNLGSWGHEEWSMGGSGKYKYFDFSGSYTNTSMDDYETADEEKFFNTGYDDKDNISLNIGYEVFPKHRIGLIYTLFDADNVGCSGYISENDLDNYKDTSNESFDLSYNGGTQNGRFLWMVRYFNTEDKSKVYDPVASNPSGWDDDEPYEKETDQQGAQGQFTANLGNYLITAGIDWIEYDIETTPYAPNEYNFDNPACYLLGKAKFFDRRFILSAGLRYDEYEVEVSEPEGNTESNENLSARLGMAYLITDYLKLRANYGEAFKMPDAMEMAGNTESSYGRTVGNPDLDPETSKTYEIGIDLSYTSFNSSLTYFYTDFKDKIQGCTLDNGDSSWENLGDATISGFEAEFSYDFGSLFNWKLEVKPYVNFTYLTEYEDEEEKEELQYTPEMTASYGISISDYDGFSTRLNFAYAGENDITDYESGWPYKDMEADDFTVADFMISKRIIKTERYGGLTLRGEIKNLFDKDYEYVKGYPMPGRSFFLGLRYDF